MRYEDFTVRIQPEAGGRFRVFAASPMGSGEFALELPPSLVAETSSLAPGVTEGASASRDFEVSAASGGTPPRDGGALGVELYEALFHGPLKALLDQCEGRVSQEPETGLRIRLEMNLRAQGMKQVASLPWELMRAPAASLPLSVSSKTTLVRAIDAMQPPEAIPFTPPLRVLVIIANPKGTVPLQLAEEEKRIRESWGRLRDVEVRFASPQLDAIREVCADHDFHVIHYMGHGGFDPQSGQGILYLERPDGGADPLDSERLRALFHDESGMLRLVFLNACKTAVATERADRDAFAGIATMLVDAGVPAVLAMQAPISDAAALVFADTFYKRIVRGDPVDTAVAEGRKAIWSEQKPGCEWATPVLFMRSKDGQLFSRPSALARARALPLRVKAALALPTLLLGAALLGAAYWPVATAVRLDVVARSARFAVRADTAQDLLSLSPQFSELTVERCRSLSFATAAMAPEPAASEADRRPPGRASFACTANSKIRLRAAAEPDRPIGALDRVRADPGASVVIAVDGPGDPVVTLDVATRQSLHVPIHQELLVTAELAEGRYETAGAAAAALGPAGYATYRVRVPEDNRFLDLETDAPTVLVVSPAGESARELLRADPLPVDGLALYGPESLEAGTPLPPRSVRVEYPGLPPGLAREIENAFVRLVRVSDLVIRRMSIEPDGLRLDVEGIVQEGAIGKPEAAAPDRLAWQDLRLSALQALRHGPWWRVGLVLVIWLAASLAAWWLVGREAWRASALVR